MTTSLVCLYRLLGTAAGCALERSKDWVVMARYRSRSLGSDCKTLQRRSPRARLLADSPDGCTEATLLAHGFTDEQSNW
jgi:hypothetical protein